MNEVLRGTNSASYNRLLAGVAAAAVSLGVAGLKPETADAQTNVTAIGQADLDRYAGSVVKIYATPSTKDGLYHGGYLYPTCTGVKVRRGNQMFVQTAAHCLGAGIGSKFGTIDPSTFPGASALDFVKSLSNNYIVEDASAPIKQRTPLAIATGIGVSTQFTDLALIKMKVIKNPGGTVTPPTPTRTYAQIPPVVLPKTDKKPVFNQQVGLYGAPDANLNRPVRAIGRFLGVYNDVEVVTDKVFQRKLLVVGITPKQPYNDSCNYGASGGSFVYKAKQGSQVRSFISGGLSTRVNETYDPYLQPDRAAKNPRDAIKNRVKAEKRARRQIAAQLGVNLTRFTTLCLFTPFQHKTTDQVIKSIGRNFAPPLVYSDNGSATAIVK